MTYFRNNIVHLFVLPSFVACCFLSNKSLNKKQVIHLFKLVYPFLKAELSMHWQPRKISATAHKVFDCLIEEGLLKQSADELQVNGSNQQVIEDLSRGVLLSLERFYLTISVLKQNGAGAMTRMELEKTCGALAEKLSELKSLNSPEFFDKALFKGFIEMLFNEGIIWADDNGKLAFGRVLESVIEDAGLVMSQQVRKSVHSLVD
jgi:glycerol-3-phosphate O-acyltransferase